MAANDGKTVPVKVAVRVRPLNSMELLQHSKKVVSLDEGAGVVEMSGAGNKSFDFDFVYGEKSTQENIYDQTTRPLINRVIDGHNATILAYGQTGSGKTFTMGTSSGNATDESAGIIPRVVRELFEKKENMGRRCNIRLSFLEIHHAEVKDLLSTEKATEKSKLKVRLGTDGDPMVVGLSTHKVNNAKEVETLIEYASERRVTAATEMNAGSSRSHAICTFTLEIGPEGHNNDDDNGEFIVEKIGKFTLVDLAGSEKVKKTKATGNSMKEGIAINGGLFALGKVINALIEGKHVSYRDSLLTRLLQNSLGGNSHTLMLACVSPASLNSDETISTLRYANRARAIKNVTQVNQSKSELVNASRAMAECVALRREVNKLKIQVAEARAKTSSSACSIVEKQKENLLISELQAKLYQTECELKDESEACIAHALRADRLAVKQQQLMAKAKSMGVNLLNDTSSTSTNQEEALNPLLLQEKIDMSDTMQMIDDQDDPQVEDSWMILTNQRHEIENLRRQVESLQRMNSLHLQKSLVISQSQPKQYGNDNDEGMISSSSPSSSFLKDSSEGGYEIVSQQYEDNEMESSRIEYVEKIEQLKNEVDILQKEKSQFKNNTKMSMEEKQRMKELEKKTKDLEKMETNYNLLMKRKQFVEVEVGRLKNEVNDAKKIRGELQRDAKAEAIRHSKKLQEESRKTVRAVFEAAKADREMKKALAENARAKAILDQKNAALSAAKKAMKEQSMLKNKGLSNKSFQNSSSSSSVEDIQKLVVSGYGESNALINCKKYLNSKMIEQPILEQNIIKINRLIKKMEKNNLVIKQNDEYCKLQRDKMNQLNLLEQNKKDLEEIQGGIKIIKSNADLTKKKLNETLKTTLDYKTAFNYLQKFASENYSEMSTKLLTEQENTTKQVHDAIEQTIEECSEKEKETLDVISNQAETIQNLLQEKNNQFLQLTKSQEENELLKIKILKIKNDHNKQDDLKEPISMKKMNKKRRHIVDDDDDEGDDEDDDEEVDDELNDSVQLAHSDRSELSGEYSFEDEEEDVWVEEDEEEYDEEDIIDDDDSDYEEFKPKREELRKNKRKERSDEMILNGNDNSLNEDSLDSIDSNFSILKHQNNITTKKPRKQCSNSNLKKKNISNFTSPTKIVKPLEKMTVPELKEALGSRGEKRTGIKSELIGRLEEYLSMQECLDGSSSSSPKTLIESSDEEEMPIDILESSGFELETELNESNLSDCSELSVVELTHVTKRKQKNPSIPIDDTSSKLSLSSSPLTTNSLIGNVFTDNLKGKKPSQFLSTQHDRKPLKSMNVNISSSMNNTDKVEKKKKMFGSSSTTKFSSSTLSSSAKWR